MQVVLDTNVLVSALLFKNKLGRIETLIKTGVVTPCFIVSSLDEMQKVLGYDKLQPYLQRANLTAKEIMESLTPHCKVFDDPKTLPDAATHFSDNYILAAATTSRAKYLVTGDKGLLGLKTFENIPIITPLEFLKLV